MQCKPVKLSHLVAVLGLVFAVATQAADMKQLRVGQDPNFEPFEYKLPDGTLVGFDIDIAQALCAEIQRKCVFVDQVFEGLIPSLMGKKIDVIISSISRTEERRKVVNFSDEIYNEPQAIAARKGLGIDASPASLKGKKLGVLKGSIQERYANKVLAPLGVMIVGYSTTQDSYLDMQTGRIDAVMANLLEVRASLVNKSKQQLFEIVASGMHDPLFDQGTGVAVRKQDTALLKQINAALKTIRENGTYQKIADQYFDFDVFGK